LIPATLPSDTNTYYNHFTRDRTKIQTPTRSQTTADKGNPSLPNSPLTTDHKGKVSKKQ
jgi:hypothetical protein